MTKYLLVAVIVLIAACGALFDGLVKSRAECERLASNNSALMEGVNLYRNKLGESVASVERLELTKKELEKNYAAVCEEARLLGIKVRRLQSTSMAAMSTELVAEAVVRDSVVIPVADVLGMGVDTVKVFDWCDPPWVEVNGVINNGKVSIELHAVDTLVQIVHRVPKKFLWFRFGTKAVRQEVVSKNPHTKVVYTEYIELRK